MEYVQAHSALDFVLLILISIIGWFGKKSIDLLTFQINKLTNAAESMEQIVQAMRLANATDFVKQVDYKEFVGRTTDQLNGQSRILERTTTILVEIQKEIERRRIDR